MKILHCADLHLGNLDGPVRDGKNARRDDTLRCMKYIAETAEIEKPNVSIIAGDLFNRSRLWSDPALDDINDSLDYFIRPLCKNSEQVALLFGTLNHDNPRAFENIKRAAADLKNLHVYTAPEVDTLSTGDGEIQILAMPGFDKGRLRVFMPDADAETENQNATTLVNGIVTGQAAKLDREKPSVLAAHYTVAGCEADNGQTFLAGQDVVILPQTIDAIGVTLGCFGHIHKPQRLGCNTPAYYSGSPNQLTFNDEKDEHGFYIHEISITGEVDSRFIHTPERRHQTIRLTQDQISEFIVTGTITGITPLARDAILRVYYDAAPEQEKALNRAAMQSYLLDSQVCGAFHVADFIREGQEDALVTDGVATEDTPAAALHRYLLMQKENGEAITDADIARLEELAVPIIREADDGRETNRHAGAFTPKRIEVTNYRSYTHAEFDFLEIRMAMVNGPNGVGKSSLFLDAIADCLYETSRDGSKGEWVRDGEKKGSVTFEFEMGGSDYRVARTRNQNGRGTLAFARKNSDTDEWENYGDTTMPLTQAKIAQVVGMDFQTFCSIALIRQDAYGIFLEADSDRRMEVLSSLLNLGIYTRAEGIAKDGMAAQRRTVASLKDRMSVLDEQMAAKEQIHAELKECENKLAIQSEQAKALDGRIKAAEREETLRQELTRQAQEKAREAANLNAQAQQKEDELHRQTAERDDAKRLAGMADTVASAVKAIEQARAELEPLVQDEANLQMLEKRQVNLQTMLKKTQGELEQLHRTKQIQTAALEQKAEIEAAVRELEQVRTDRQSLSPKIAEYDAVVKTIADLKNKASEFVGESRVRIGRLKNQIEGAEKKAQLLTDSGCPIADTASCKFLKDAQEAKSALTRLQKELETVKNADREKYGGMTAQIEEAKKRLDSIGNPKADLDALSEKERRAAPVAALAGKLEAAAATVAQIEKQEDDKKTLIFETEAEIQEIAEKLPPLRQSAEKVAQLRSKIKESEPTAALQSQCAAAVATVKALNINIDLITKDAEKARLEAVRAQEEADTVTAKLLANAGDDTLSMDALQSNRNALARDNQRIAKQIGGLQARLDSIAEAAEQWKEYRAELGVAAKKQNDYETLAAAFGIDGIQYVIIRSIVPEIEGRANAILSAMTGGRMAVDFRTEREVKKSKKIVNSLDVWITSLSGGCRPYSSHSGGEKVKIALAVTLALADVKARRAGVRLGMLFIDEPPFLDMDGTDAYADALISMANRNPEMRILAISHDPQLKARFDQNITVTAGENGSRVTTG